MEGNPGHNRLSAWSLIQGFARDVSDVLDWFIRYAMVIRVPLAFSGLMMLLFELGRSPRFSKMFRGLFVLSRWEMATVTFLAITTAWVIVSSAETAWFEANRRQLVPNRPPAVVARVLAWLDHWVGHPPMRRFWAWRFAAVAVVAAPLLARAWRVTTSDLREAGYVPPSYAVSLLAGSGLFLLLYVAVASAFGFLDRHLRRRRMERWKRWQAKPGAVGREFDINRRMFGKAITRIFGGGYFRKNGRILPGPMFALVQLLFFTVVYGLVGTMFRPDRLGADGCLTANAFGWKCLPPLASIMFVISVSCLFLTGMTFFLDRWRLPTLSVLVIALAFSRFQADVDHTFPLVSAAVDGTQTLSQEDDREASDEAASPARVAQRVIGAGPERRLIVVAASGGGITSASWTARVLTGLEAAYGTRFTDRLAAISGVSGGSVGTMFYLAAPLRSPNRAQLRSAIVAAAERTALRNVAWGFAYPDLHRLLRSPFSGSEQYFDARIDRAWALEEAWRSTLRTQARPINGLLAASADATLGSWQERIGKGEIPVPIFNAMTVEDGQQLLLTPGQIHPVPMPPGASYPGYATLDDLYPGRDLSVVTAARLSASFPYVSPMARPAMVRPGELPFHVTDGGFFDNDGAVALQAWLEAALPPDTQPTQVLFVQIRWGQWSPSLASAGSGTNQGSGIKPLPQTDPRGIKGIGFSLFGPMEALLAARSSTQNVRNKRAMQLLAERLARRQVTVSTVEFDLVDPPNAPLPLSWLLGWRDKLALACRWSSDDVQTQVASVGAFIGADANAAAAARTAARSAIPPPADADRCRAIYPR